MLDEHPRDLVPWIGLLEVHEQEQRHGYASEAAAALLGWARARGATALRLGVAEGNASGLAFWRSVGFRDVEERERIGPGGPVRVTVVELGLVSQNE